MIVGRKIYMLHEVERAEKRKELRSKCVKMIVNVNIEIASDDELVAGVLLFCCFSLFGMMM